MKKDNPAELLKLAASVKGFMPEKEGLKLFELALEAAAAGPCLEVGSFCGKSAVYIGAACRQKGTTLFTIDHHRGSEEQQPGQIYFDPEIYDERSRRIDSLPLLRETLEKAELEDTVVPMVTTSKAASRNWATPLSLVFIDGGHSYESTLTDYQCWAGHLLKGGYLVFHDIYPDPFQGGQAPYEVYKLAVNSGDFTMLPLCGSLGILRKR